MATVRDLIARKGGQVHWVSENATVLDTTQRMNEHRIGAMVVLRDDRIVGMFTERDVLRRVVAEELPPARVRVGEVMTSDVLSCSPNTPVEEISRIMKDRRIRHLPVCDECGRMVGLVSIGDVNAYHASSQEETIQFLNEMVCGR